MHNAQKNLNVKWNPNIDIAHLLASKYLISRNLYVYFYSYKYNKKIFIIIKIFFIASIYKINIKIQMFSKCWMSLCYNLFSIQWRISAKTWCLVSGSSRKSWWHAPGKIFRVLSSTLLRLTRRGRLCSIPHLALLTCTATPTR